MNKKQANVLKFLSIQKAKDEVFVNFVQCCVLRNLMIHFGDIIIVRRMVLALNTNAPIVYLLSDKRGLGVICHTGTHCLFRNQAA